MNILPVATGKLGVGVVGGVGFDLLTGETAHVVVIVPVTYQVSEKFRINLNAGWLHERGERQDFFTWGAGFEWKVYDPVTFIAEIFGQAGHGSEEPRFQAGLRFTPREWFDIDVIYGRNITGEDADWITLGLTVRFDVAGR
jgi:outer membrane autotransporter protein